MKIFKIKIISRLALLLALIVVLDYTSRLLPIFKTPNGGTLSFVPIAFIVASINAKPWQGFIFGSIASIFTFFIGSQWFINLGQFLFDYPLAIGGSIACGSIIWRKIFKWKFSYSTKITILSLSVITIQFISYTIAFYFYLPKSGLITDGVSNWNILLNILIYNSIYMGPIMVGNTILATLILPKLKKII